MISQVLPKEIVDFLRVLEFWDHILVGLAKTMWLYVWALLLGFFLGLLLSLLRQYGGRILSRIATGYVEIVRGTPLLVQLFFIYFLPFVPPDIDLYMYFNFRFRRSSLYIGLHT